MDSEVIDDWLLEIIDMYSDKEDQLLSIKSNDGLYKYLCKFQKKKRI